MAVLSIASTRLQIGVMFYYSGAHMKYLLYTKANELN